jgi:hypothetical protein
VDTACSAESPSRIRLPSSFDQESTAGGGVAVPEIEREGIGKPPADGEGVGMAMVRSRFRIGSGIGSRW